MHPDLHQTRLDIQSGKTSARTEMERAIEIAQSAACEHTFLRTTFEDARAQAAAASPDLPLVGLSVSVKDLFDIAGQPTAAGSIVLAHTHAATADAPSVARLRAAGGAVIGRTNMSEFAFSGVGINRHHGTPASVASSAGQPRVPGGSSSGAAVSVAAGAAFIGLGSDTGGSIRIPAALNGIVGFKSTARLVPTQGALPLSTTLDTVCAMTRSVRDAITAHEILAARSVSTTTRDSLTGCRLAVVTNVFTEDLEPAVATAFERSLRALRSAGARIEEITLPALADLASINSTGGFSAAESYAWHRHLLERSGAGYDPRVSQRILKGAGMKAFEYIDLIRARADWIARMQAAMAGFDAMLSPTVPVTAPLISSVAPGAERDDAFFKLNGLLLRNPSVVNMLDGCALSLPCQESGSLPVGLMIWHAAMHDDEVLSIASLVEGLLRPT